MNKLIQKSWISIVFWGLVLAAILFTMPDMGELVRDKGQAEIDSHYSYPIAQNILKQMNKVSEQDNVLDILMVYHNPEKLTQENLGKIQEKVTTLENSKAKYGVIKVLNAFTDKELEEQVLSEDGTTLLLPLSIQKQGRTVESIRKDMTALLTVEGLETYSTGSDFILEDFIKTVEEGVQKTELITIILIVVILILVFRSPAAPLATLATVGLTFLVSRGIVLLLVDHLNFTISNFTNVFLVLVLFGIGTDYTMLLLMRFREELHNGLDTNTAIIKTYRTAGKTVVLSSLTIFIGFTCLVFSQFKVYRSASAVAVGVAVLILMIFTFLPALMKLFGKHIFWSPLKTSGHADSKVWETVSAFSAKRPHLALLFVLAVCGLIYFHTGNLSYNNMKEVGGDYSSVKGFDIVSRHFSKGKALPVTIAIKNTAKMDTQYALSELDDLTETVKLVQGVDKVYSVTQPKGERIDELYIKDQTTIVKDGLNEAADGVDRIYDGLGDAVSKLQSGGAEPKSVEELQKGARDMTTRIGQISRSVTEMKTGMNSGAQASRQLSGSIESMDHSMELLETSLTELQKAYSALGQGYAQIGGGLGQLLQQTKSFQTALGGVATLQSKLEATHPELAADTTFIAMKQTVLQLNAKLQELIDGIAELHTSIAAANGSLEKANQGLAQAQGGIAAMKTGTGKLKQGSAQMSTLLTKATEGQSRLSDALGLLEDGSKRLADGQDQVAAGIKSLSAESAKLTEGLTDARKGLGEISTGLKDANSYVEKLGQSKTAATFFIPEDKINSGDFAKSMDMYLSEDRTITKINIMLRVDPYSEEAMEVVKNIHTVVSAGLKDSSFRDAEWGIAGISQMNVDLRTMSEKDFNLSSMIMLTGILIVLFVVTRDFWMSVSILLSLVAAYYISITASGLVFRHILDKGDLTWNVPFFSFIMIIALGVDYSIFLVMRHRENGHLPLTESIVLAAKSVGGVIFSAGIILSGTFAAMYPSGVLTLMQLSITVIIGILLLCLVFLPVFIPAAVSVKARIIEGFGRRKE